LVFQLIHVSVFLDLARSRGYNPAVLALIGRARKASCKQIQHPPTLLNITLLDEETKRIKNCFSHLRTKEKSN